MKYKPNDKSLSKHELPAWFDSAKFGIFIHWGLYSVPAFAEVRGLTFPEIMAREGTRGMMFRNPYAEWYLNSLRIPGTKTREYHERKYGPDFKYDDFISIFNDEVNKWDPGRMVSLFRDAGAKYVVLVTKHHDGFCLWDTEISHPIKGTYHSDRDIILELSREVRGQGMRFGVYYSSLLDWSFTEQPITDIASELNNEPRHPEYSNIVRGQWLELIDRYDPDILWSDIGYPLKHDFRELFAHFYNKKEDGVVNDRWNQIPNWVKRFVNNKVIDKILDSIVRRVFSAGGHVVLKPRFHHDFVTPEYTSFDRVPKFKWESTRGIGYSFGYNRMETPDDMLKLNKLVALFVDIVSKGGNLLLNVGPKADGSIPDIQKQLLIEFGRWLKINEAGIFGSHPLKDRFVLAKLPKNMQGERTVTSIGWF
ncbi:MAG: alpha-L-fucosidase [Promethearchaeota archaeon]